MPAVTFFLLLLSIWKSKILMNTACFENYISSGKPSLPSHFSFPVISIASQVYQPNMVNQVAIRLRHIPSYYDWTRNPVEGFRSPKRGSSYTTIICRGPRSIPYRLPDGWFSPCESLWAQVSCSVVFLVCSWQLWLLQFSLSSPWFPALCLMFGCVPLASAPISCWMEPLWRWLY